MTRFHLPENTQLFVNGTLYKVVALTSNDEVHLSNLETGEPYLTSSKDLANAIYDGKARLNNANVLANAPTGKPRQTSFDAFDEKDKSEARRRLKFVKKMDCLYSSSLNQAAIDAGRFFSETAAQETLPSVRTLKRWYQCWVASGQDIRSLVPRHAFKGATGEKMCSRVSAILLEVTEKYYLTKNKVTAREVYRIVRQSVAKANMALPRCMKVKAPSERSVYRYLGSLDPYDVMLAQKGAQIADQKFKPVYAGPTAAYPLQKVQCDHHIIDLIVVYPNGEVLGRLWLTVAIDLYSRMVVGFDLSPESPSYRSIMRCLRQALAPKEKFLEEVFQEFLAQSDCSDWAGFESEWPCFGMIETLIVDNGLEFHSQDLLDAATQLGVSIEYNPARKPYYKGVVERFFGTLNSRLIHSLPGTTMSNPVARADYKSEKEAKLTIQDVHYLITKFIVDEYSRGFHKGIRCSPIDKWLRGTKKRPVRLLERREDLSVLTSSVTSRTLSRLGIRLFDLAFQSQALQDLYRRLVKGNIRVKANPKVLVKYDPENLMTIYVEDAQNKVFLPANCTYQDYANGLSLWRHKKVKSYLGTGSDTFSEEKLYEARQELYEVAQQVAGSRQKKRRRNANRLLTEEDKVGNLHTVSPSLEPSHQDELTRDFPRITFEEIEEELKKNGWTSSVVAPKRGAE